MSSLLDYCLPTYGGARDGVFVVNGYIYSRDGETWRECTSNGVDQNPNPWEQGSYIIKGILPNGSKLYMDSNGREYSTDMLGWYGTTGGGAYPPAGAAANCFFWKGEYHVTAKLEVFGEPKIYQHIFNTTLNEWEGGEQGGGTTNGGNPIDSSKEILNGDTIWYGDSKPDGTAVLGCAKGAGNIGIPSDGEWKPVKLVDGGGGQDSFQPITALQAYAGQIRSIKYNENHNYWLAITQGSVFKSDVGSVDNWTETSLPVSKPWSSCMWDGSRWIAVSMVTAESLVLFSSDGLQWETNNSIDPMWSIGEENQRFLNVMSTNGKTVIGFSPGNCPHTYNVTKR